MREGYVWGLLKQMRDPIRRGEAIPGSMDPEMFNDWMYDCSLIEFDDERLPESVTKWKDHSVCNRGYEGYQEHVVYQQRTLQSRNFRETLTLGLSRLSRLASVSLEGEWALDMRRNIGNLELENFASSATDLLRLFLIQMPGLDNIVIGDTQLLEGCWESVIECPRRFNRFTTFYTSFRAELYHHGEEIFDVNYTAIGDYRIHGGRHPGLSDHQPTSASEAYMLRIDYSLRDRLQEIQRSRTDVAVQASRHNPSPVQTATSSTEKRAIPSDLSQSASTSTTRGRADCIRATKRYDTYQYEIRRHCCLHRGNNILICATTQTTPTQPPSNLLSYTRRLLLPIANVDSTHNHAPGSQITRQYSTGLSTLCTTV